MSLDFLKCGPSDEFTLKDVVDRQDRLAEEAREVMPYSFDECTYTKGYLRQSVWSCMDCGEKGVCYGCSISCHAEHRLVELWTKRSFRCDCPTTTMLMTTACESEHAGPSTSASAPRKRRCSLNPPEKQPQDPNDRNRYSQNFANKFCRCGRDYDPELETEAMINCMVCEDWFHESCLNLQPRRKEEATPNGDLTLNDDDEDEEADCLIPSESYDGLICATCVNSHSLIRGRAGTEGWMMIEPVNGAWTVIGRKPPAMDRGRTESTAQETERTESTALETPEPSTGSKRPLEASDEKESKKARVEDAPDEPSVEPQHNAQPESAVKPEPEPETKPDLPTAGAGDVFLTDGIRALLLTELDAATIASLPFPLEDEETYEPPKDEDEPETFEQRTERIVGGLPRVQAIEALHGYQTMKDKLMAMMNAKAQAGNSSVTKEDVENMFEELRRAKR